MSITAANVTTALAPVVADAPMFQPPPQPGDAATSTPVQCIVVSGTAQAPVSIVPVATFVDLFGAATGMTAAALNAIDGGKLGYAMAIAAWQAAGYIPAS